MLQAVMIQPGEIKFREVAQPKPAKNEVLVKIKRIGVCGSDIHVYHGEHPYTSYPVVQGHEVSGTIEELGSGVINFAVGDKVTIQPQIVCGKCYNCKNGRYNICEELKVMGFQDTGTASEYFSVEAEKVLKLSENITFDEGALIEPLAVAVHAVRRGGEVQGKNILVLGAGPIGNLIAQAAKGMGAKKVIITDLNDYRLETAKECGVDICVSPVKEDLSKVIVKEFGQDRADVIFECVGITTTMDQAIENARKGTNIVVVGVFPKKAKVDLGLVQDRELNLIGTLMYREEDYIKSIELVDNQLVDLKKLITKEFKFKDYKKMYEYLDSSKDEVMKIIINLDN